MTNVMSADRALEYMDAKLETVTEQGRVDMRRTLGPAPRFLFQECASKEVPVWTASDVTTKALLLDLIENGEYEVVRSVKYGHHMVRPVGHKFKQFWLDGREFDIDAETVVTSSIIQALCSEK